MRIKKRQKYFSIMLIFALVLSLFTPAVAPFSVSAAEEDATISVADGRALNNDGSIQNVKGYIVGYVISKDNVSANPEEFKGDTNFAIADSADVTDSDEMLFVQIPSKFRAEFGLKQNPEILGEEVIVTGKMEQYFSSNGVKDLTEMVFTSKETDPEPAPEPEPIELKSITDARAQGEGEVKTKGVVTAKLKNTLHIQDEAAGIAIYPVISDVNLGDEIIVSGSLSNYNGLLQIQDAKLEERNESSGVPAPIPLSGNELQDHESELAIVENITLTAVEDGGNWANFTAKDAGGNQFLVRDENNTLGLHVNENYDSITGIVSQFNGTFQLIPRSEADIVADQSVVQPVTASPGEGKVPAGTEVTLKTSTPDAEIYYTTDGSEPDENSTPYESAIIIDEAVTIKAIAYKEGLEASKVSQFSYTTYDPEEGIMIHDIQGESHVSPMAGEFVEKVEGIVTYKYDIRGSNYFHMQTPGDKYDGNPNTSEGIVVYTGREANLSVGDLIEVTGTVSEYYIDGYDGKEKTDLSITQINARDDQGGVITVKESDVALPAPIKITSSEIPDTISGENGFDVFEPENYAIDFWESIEGMRVEVEPSRAVGPQEHGDLVVVTEEFESENETDHGGIRLTSDAPNAQAIHFKVNPNGPARDLKVATGDTFTKTLSGVVNYGFGNYKVYADLDDVKNAHEATGAEPEKTNIIPDEDKLSIATYNVENFSANKSETPDSKAKNIARAFVEDMNSPDIIGVVEVMANNGQKSTSSEADKSYERLIKEIEEKGGPTYDYANIDPEFNKDGGAPGGNIRVGFLYNPERVSLTDAEHGGTSDAVEYKDGQLTLNPGRVSPGVFENTRKPLAAQFEFNGESVVVIANHLNSKLGDDPFFGQNQPPNLESRKQRKVLAAELNSFVKDIKNDNPKENVIVLGDMNDYEFSEPLQILEGNELTNLADKVPSEDRYSYVYQGNSHVFDHILVSNNIAEATEIDFLHVNADFTDMHGRASDHDPVLAQIDFSQADNSFKLPIMHMNDTHARADGLPKMITAIHEFRDANPDSLLLHAGDVFSGTLYFNEFKGQADLALMNLMDLDAMVFGNHEFDLGAREGGHESLSNFVKEANFPLLGTNIDFSGDPFMKDLDTNAYNAAEPNNGEIYNSIVKEVNGEKIGIFGLTTEDTKDIANPMEIEFEDFVAAAEKAVEEFENEGINKIVAVTHLGYDSSPAVGNDLRLAKEVEGIDIIIGGHSHSIVTPPVVIEENDAGEEKDPTVIAQAGEYAEYLGTLNVSFDEDGKVVGQAGELLEVANYDEDAEATEVLAKYKERIEEISNEEIGAEAMKDLANPRLGEGSTDSVRANETELGNLVTDAMLAKAKEKFPETVISLQNGGGIRAPIVKGPITTGEVIDVLPFGNDPVIAELTGQEIKDILEHSVKEAPGESGGFLHVSGMKFYYDSTKEAGNRIVEMSIDNDGELTKIDLDEKYLVTTNNFTGQGGDGFETFAKAYEDGRVRDIGEIDWEQLRDYMVEEEYLNGVVDPEREGRIIDLKGEELPGEPGNPDDPDKPDDPDNPGKPDDGDKEPGGKWLAGKGKPSADLGEIGDLYLDILSGDVYLKTSEGWKWQTNLNAPPGEGKAPWFEGDGKPSADLGENGDLYLDRKNGDIYLKSDGVWERIGSIDERNGASPGPGDNNDDHNGTPPGTKDGNGPTLGDGGKKLPVTATSMYTFMLIGLTLFLFGAGTLIYRRMKHST